MRMRDALIIALACIIAIAVGAWLFFDGSGQRARMQEVQVLAQGSQAAGITERKNYRIRSTEELKELWSMTYGAAAPAIPAVDFEYSEVLAVFDGTHTSGGYAVAVAQVEDSALTRTVHIVRTAPTPECVTASTVTNPFVLVRVPATDLSITRVEEEVRSCGG